MAAAVTEVVEALGGLSNFVKAGQTVLLKPNLFSPHLPEDAVTTHPELVRQVVLLCAKAEAGRIWVGDSPVGLHSENELWSRTGMTAAVAGTPAELKSWQVKQIPIPCGDDVLAVPEWFREVDVVISLPKLKTHTLTTLTCGLKNVYGIVNGPAKARFHVKYPSPATMTSPFWCGSSARSNLSLRLPTRSWPWKATARRTAARCRWADCSAVAMPWPWMPSPAGRCGFRPRPYR